jgi:hypothetical protein
MGPVRAFDLSIVLILNYFLIGIVFHWQFHFFVILSALAIFVAFILYFYADPALVPPAAAAALLSLVCERSKSQIRGLFSEHTRISIKVH